MREDLAVKLNTIRNLAVNPGQDRILATTSQSQIYYADLPSKEGSHTVSYCFITENFVIVYQNMFSSDLLTECIRKQLK